MKDKTNQTITGSALISGELLTLERARMLFKGGKGISIRRLREKITAGEIPSEAVIDNGRGVTLIHLQKLLGVA